MAEGPYFSGAEFGLVDAVFAPTFRFFNVLPGSVSAPLFDSLPKASAWREALNERKSVQRAVNKDYRNRFLSHLAEHGALINAILNGPTGPITQYAHLSVSRISR